MAVKITPLNNGPYRVEFEGDLQIVMPSGRALEISGPRVFLCRCGHSQNKPFCDSSHKRVGFQAAEVVEPTTA